MKRKIDIEHWERKELFNFFKDFDEPYYGISFFLYYLYLVLKAVNRTEAFKYRIEDDNWIRFTSESHPRNFGLRDSIPKITMGKYYHAGDRMMIPVSVHVHHALADGLHVGQFFTTLEDLFREKNG